MPASGKTTAGKLLSEKLNLPFYDIDEEIENVVMNQYAKALELLNNAMPKLHEVAKIVFEREKISGDEFRSIMEAE